MELHGHDFYLLMFFTKGHGSHTIELAHYPVAPGSVFFMSPSEVHEWKLSEESDGFVVFFNASFYRMEANPQHLTELPFYQSGGKLRYAEILEKDREGLEALFDLMMAAYRQESSYRDRILRAYLDVLLFQLSALIAPEKVKKVQQVSIISALEHLIEQHYAEHQPVTFYAEQLHVTVSQLNTSTRQQLNKSVIELVQERLIAEARRLLAYSTKSVSEIAWQLNFSDNSYFSRFFKKHSGMSPEAFRNQL
jgi:AraC-like DNA-binding protein